MFEITKQTVNASEGQFEEHPESYHPRVFVAVTKVMTTYKIGGDGLPEYSPEVYELLTDGQAISWDCLPQECCGFDFWTVYADSIHDITMTRAPRVLPTEIVDLPYFVGAKEWKERHGDVVPQFDGKTRPATTGAGYCTCKIEQPLLDHLPEGSY